MKFIGGFNAMIELLPQSYFDTMGDLDILLIIIYASTGLSVLVEPTFYQRIFAARSYKNVRNALIIGVFIWGSYDWLITILAMSAKAGVIKGLLPPDVAPDAALLTVVVAASCRLSGFIFSRGPIYRDVYFRFILSCCGG